RAVAGAGQRRGAADTRPCVAAAGGDVAAIRQRGREAMRMRGAAPVLGLWLVALPPALVGAVALAPRVEHLQGRVLAETAAGQERARAGIEYALARLQGSPDQPAWLADGRRYRWQFEHARIDLRIIDESGKVDINNADPALLA